MGTNKTEKDILEADHLHKIRTVMRPVDRQADSHRMEMLSHHRLATILALISRQHHLKMHNHRKKVLLVVPLDILKKIHRYGDPVIDEYT